MELQRIVMELKGIHNGASKNCNGASKNI